MLVLPLANAERRKPFVFFAAPRPSGVSHCCAKLVLRKMPYFQIVGPSLHEFLLLRNAYSELSFTDPRLATTASDTDFKLSVSTMMSLISFADFAPVVACITILLLICYARSAMKSNEFNSTNKTFRKCGICLMRRGRGRSRTSSQSTSSTQKSTRRRGRSTSRANPRASDRPRRRSSRLAGFAVTTEDTTLPITGSQAEQPFRSAGDAATSRQQQRQRRGAELAVEIEDPGPAHQGLQTSMTLMQTPTVGAPNLPDVNGALGQSNCHFHMELTTHPPDAVESGAALPPLVARVWRQRDSDRAAGLHQLLALVIPVSEGRDGVIQPEQSDALRVMTHVSESPNNGNEDTGYVRFEGLTIQEPGSYRLRICLVRMRRTQAADGGLYENAENICVIHSTVVQVYPRAQRFEPCRFTRATTISPSAFQLTSSST